MKKKTVFKLIFVILKKKKKQRLIITHLTHVAAVILLARQSAVLNDPLVGSEVLAAVAAVVAEAP